MLPTYTATTSPSGKTKYHVLTFPNGDIVKVGSKRAADTLMKHYETIAELTNDSPDNHSEPTDRELSVQQGSSVFGTTSEPIEGNVGTVRGDDGCPRDQQLDCQNIFESGSEGVGVQSSLERSSRSIPSIEDSEPYQEATQWLATTIQRNVESVRDIITESNNIVTESNNIVTESNNIIGAVRSFCEGYSEIMSEIDTGSESRQIEGNNEGTAIDVAFIEVVDAIALLPEPEYQEERDQYGLTPSEYHFNLVEI